MKEHENKVNDAYKCFKKDIVKELFPGEKKQASNIILSLAKICEIDLSVCKSIDYFNILKIYSSVWTRVKMYDYSDERIAFHLSASHSDYVKNENMAAEAATFIKKCVNDSSYTIYEIDEKLNDKKTVINSNTNNNTNNNTTKIISIVSCVLLFISLICIVLMAIVIKNKEEQIKEKENIIIEKEKIIAENESNLKKLEKKAKEYSSLKNKYDSDIEDKEKETKIWKNKYYGIKDEYDFYNSHAVIIGDDDYFYHTYSCKYLDLRSFYIYNIENAKAQGYEPCPYCQ